MWMSFNPPSNRKQRHQPAVRGRGGTAAAAACPDSNFVTKASIDLAKRSCPDSKFVTKASTFVTKVSTFVTKLSTDFAKRSCPDTKVSTFVTKASTLSPRRSIAPVTSPVDVAIAVLISVVDALVDAMSSILSACQWNVRGVGLVRSRLAQKSKRKVVEHLHVPFGGKFVLRLRLRRVTRAAVAAAWDLD